MAEGLYLRFRPHVSGLAHRMSLHYNPGLFAPVNVSIRPLHDKVAFYNSRATGFEPSNGMVVSSNPIHSAGILVTTAPEPASATVLGVGCRALRSPTAAAGPDAGVFLPSVPSWHGCLFGQDVG